MLGVYAYYDTKYDSYCYVGKDSNFDKKVRYSAHKCPSYYNKQPFNRVLQNNPKRYEYHKLVELSDDFTDDDLNELESLFITELNTYHYENPYGFNFTKGGEGTVGFNHSEETKSKISETMIKKGISKGENNPFYGKTHTEESKKKMSETRIKKGIGKGENNPRWKSYARVIKVGFDNGKQLYALMNDGKRIKRSVNKQKLEREADYLNGVGL